MNSVKFVIAASNSKQHNANEDKAFCHNPNANLSPFH